MIMAIGRAMLPGEQPAAPRTRCLYPVIAKGAPLWPGPGQSAPTPASTLLNRYSTGS